MSFFLDLTIARKSVVDKARASCCLGCIYSKLLGEYNATLAASKAEIRK